MPTATKKRKKAARELVPTWEPAGHFSQLRGLLAIDDGKEQTVYVVCEVKGDAPYCFECQPLDGRDPYMVKLSHGGQPLTCDCFGWLRWEKCKHTSEIGALVANGKL